MCQAFSIADVWLLSAVCTFAAILHKQGLMELEQVSFSHSFYMSVVAMVILGVALVLLCFQSYTVRVTDDDSVELQSQTKDKSEYQELDKD